MVWFSSASLAQFVMDILIILDCTVLDRIVPLSGKEALEYLL